jgi:hypothetical protein
LAENNAKLVPRPSQLAPRREGVPADSRITSALLFRSSPYPEAPSYANFGKLKGTSKNIDIQFRLSI